MAGKTINNKGEIKVTTTDVSEIEDFEREDQDFFREILKTLRRIEFHLSHMTGIDLSIEEFDEWD